MGVAPECKTVKTVEYSSRKFFVQFLICFINLRYQLLGVLLLAWVVAVSQKCHPNMSLSNSFPSLATPKCILKMI